MRLLCFFRDEVFVAAEGADQQFEVFRMELFLGKVVEDEHEDDDAKLGCRETQDQFPAWERKGEQPNATHEKRYSTKQRNSSSEDKLDNIVQIVVMAAGGI